MLSSAAPPAWPPTRATGTEWIDPSSRSHFQNSKAPQQTVTALMPSPHILGSDSSLGSGPTSGSGSGSGPTFRQTSSRLPAQLPPHIKHGLPTHQQQQLPHHHSQLSHHHPPPCYPQHHLLPQSPAPMPMPPAAPTDSPAPPPPHQDPAYQLPLVSRRIPKTPLYIPAALRPPERPIRHSPSSSAAIFAAGSPNLVYTHGADHTRSLSRSSTVLIGTNSADTRTTNSPFDFGGASPVSFFLSLIPGFGGSGPSSNSSGRAPSVNAPNLPASPRLQSSNSTPKSRSRPVSASYSRSSLPSRRQSATSTVLIPDTVVAAIAARLQPDMPQPDQAWPPVEGMPGRGHWKPDFAALVCDAPKCDTKFTIFNRRHHCRRCGLVFCSVHSRFAVQLDQECRFHPLGGWFRACGSCWRDFCVWDRLESERNSAGASPDLAPNSVVQPSPEFDSFASVTDTAAAATNLRKHIINGSFHVSSTSPSSCSSSSHPNSTSALCSSHEPSTHNSSATSVDSTSAASRSVHKPASPPGRSDVMRTRDSNSSASSATVQVHQSHEVAKDRSQEPTTGPVQDSSHATGTSSVSIPVSNDSNKVFASEGNRNDRNRQSIFNPLGVSVPDQWNWSTF